MARPGPETHSAMQGSRPGTVPAGDAETQPCSEAVTCFFPVKSHPARSSQSFRGGEVCVCACACVCVFCVCCTCAL